MRQVDISTSDRGNGTLEEVSVQARNVPQKTKDAGKIVDVCLDGRHEDHGIIRI